MPSTKRPKSKNAGPPGSSLAVPADRRHDALCDWFQANARLLPWRRRRSGYRALVAELMLQQTQVSRVVGRYEDFLRKFPSVRRLAAATEQEVLACWQGIGYYRRAIHLHKAAKMIVLKFGGRVPRDVASLLQLPGVGRYTAGAIASIVHNQPEPIVDGNVQRVLARWYARREAPNSPASMKWAWEKAGMLVADSCEPGRFNEALMELGSLICTPRSPRCDQCPVFHWCEARRQGLQDQIPPPKLRLVPKEVHHHAVVIRRNGAVLLEQRGGDGMWSSMWQTPTIESDHALGPFDVIDRLPMRVAGLTRAGAFIHQTSHRRITFQVFQGRSAVRRGNWIRLDDVASLPMSNAQRRVLHLAGVVHAESR